MKETDIGFEKFEEDFHADPKTTFINNSIIYMVRLDDYDRHDSVGYFIDRKKADECCKYLNSEDRSEYDNDWYVEEFTLNTTDYNVLNKEVEERERREFETRLERERQKELKELARLKAKYEQ